MYEHVDDGDDDDNNDDDDYDDDGDDDDFDGDDDDGDPEPWTTINETKLYDDYGLSN